GRTAFLNIAGKSFAITEPSASCTFSATPLDITVPAGGGTGTIAVTTQFLCGWGSSTSASWIAVAGSATGSGTATYTVPANTGTIARSATINIAGIPINVTQGASTGAVNTATVGPTPTNMRSVDTGKSPGTSRKPVVLAAPGGTR